MRLTDEQRAALDRLRAQRTSAQAQAAELAAKLRSFYYPKQAAFCASQSKLKAVIKTRRAGFTVFTCREFLARSITIAGWRATITHTTGKEARKRAWENDTNNALVDTIRQFGQRSERKRGVEQYALGGVLVDIYDGDMILGFSNGSQIDLMGADHLDAINKQRGGAKHVFLIDEAQDFDLLHQFYEKVAVPAIQDFKGEVWVGGTPGQDCAGMFHDMTKDPESSDSEEAKRLQKAWEVHRIAQVDNPFFGATVEERYENTAGEALRLNGWTPEHPDFQREIMGRWVREDGNYVYAVHQVPEHQLCFAPARYEEDGFPDLELAMDDLPDRATRTYFLALGADLGTRDDFAFVLWAWSLVDPTLYEVASFKKPGLDYDEMAALLRSVRERVVVGLVVADAGGGGKPAVMGWSKDWAKRYNVPVEEAEKSNKELAIKLVNNDIRTGKLRVRSGGVWLAEARVHRWAKLRSETGKRVEDARTANHALDAGLYSHRHSYHHRGIVPQDGPPRGSPEHMEREERAVEQAIDEELEDGGRQWWS